MPASSNLLANAASLPWTAGGEKAGQVKFSWAGERLKITTVGPRPLGEWFIRVETPIAAAIKKDAILYLRYKIRCLNTRDETGVGMINPTVQLTAAPYTKEIAAPFSAGGDWAVFATWARVSQDYRAGSMDINFRLGFAPQELEIENLELFCLPSSWDTTRLPVTPAPSYAGREPEAGWRKQAAERIELLRKQDLRVEVTDEGGHALPAVSVKVEQIKHAYRFGTAVAFWNLMGDPKDADTISYRSVLKESFDTCGPESDLKWPNWIKQREFNLKALAWLRDNGFPVRGHVLLWPAWDQRTPAFLRTLKDTPDQLRSVIFEHVRDELAATTPYTDEWDVINEPIFNHGVLDAVGGRPFMADVFREARKQAPDTRLFLNEAVTLSDNRMMGEFRKIVDGLVDEKAPFNGLGIQCHYSGWTLTPPDEILSTLDSLQHYGKLIEVTEFDVDTLDEKLQADYLRDFYTAVFSHPGTTGIQMWGFWEGRHWKPFAALWKKDWTLRPVGRAYLDLVRGAWWTKAGGKTDADGAWSLRAFKGRQRITLTLGARTLTREVDLGDQPETVKIVLRDE